MPELFELFTRPRNEGFGLRYCLDRRRAERRGRHRAASDRRHGERRRSRFGTLLLAFASLAATAHAPKLTLKPRVSIEFAKEARLAFLADGIIPSAETYEPLVQEAATTYGLDPALIRAVMQMESAFNPLAVSKAGAQGLMQIMPELAQELSVVNVFDPQQNIMAGARYLRWLLDLYEGDVSMALAGYNAGPGSVARYGAIPPFEETQHYVETITRLVERHHRDEEAE